MVLPGGNKFNGYKLRVVTGATLAAALEAGKGDVATETVTNDASSLRQDVVDAHEWKF